jgi:FO synthase
MHAIGRLAYHPHVTNIQASWVKIGFAGVLQLLQAGVNDLGGTLMNENISRAAGARHGQGKTGADFAALVEPIGRTLVQRTTTYGRIETSGTLVPAAAPRRRAIPVSADN